MTGQDGAASGQALAWTVLQDAPVGVALLPADGPPLLLNPALAGILSAVRASPEQLWRAVREHAEVGGHELALGQGWLSVSLSRTGLPDGTSGTVVSVQDVTARRQEHERLTRMATHDPLTGLGNRTLLQEQLATDVSVAAHLRVGLLFCDLDGFKEINDALGHEVGDAVLVAVADRLSAALRVSDTAIRIGGDEFVVLARMVRDEAALAELVRRVSAVLEPPVQVGELSLRVRMSVGSVLSRPGEDARALLRRADAAMFTDKRGQNGRAGRSPGPQQAMLAELEQVAAPFADTVDLQLLRVHAARGRHRSRRETA